MKISLIVPAYNEELYIGQLLDSVLTQTRVPDEIIICNNLSTDNTVKIINKYQKSLPIKIINESKKGIRFAVDTAWRHATGDLILRSDADCVLPLDWVSKYEKVFVANPNLAACGGGFRALDGNQFFKLIAPIVVQIDGIILTLIKGHKVLFGANFAIRRDVLTKLNGYYSDTPVVQDDIYICKKLFQNKFQYEYYHEYWNYTSLRRFNNLQNSLVYFLSVVSPKLYFEKSI